MNRLNLVLLSKSAHRGMIRSVVEHLMEPTGYLIGENRNEKARVFTIYPVQTSIRRPTQVVYGNNNAIKRIRKLEQVWENGEGYLGGFHAHILGRGNNSIDPRKANTLSESDLDFIQGEMKEMGKDYWIEILLKLVSANYKRPHEIGEFARTRNDFIESKICDDPFHSYKLTFSAHLIDSGGKTRQIPIRDEQIRIVRRGYTK